MAHRIVIVGGGFGGVYAAKRLCKHKELDITLIDRRNFHLFQPLLYQVATGGLSPGDITFPIRGIFKKFSHFKTINGNVLDIDPIRKRVVLNDLQVPFDSLIVSTGAKYHYFGNPVWEDIAPGLKSIENAIFYRGKILKAFEQAEIEPDPVQRKKLLTFVIIGGGPTGVEMAGAVAELARQTLRHDFRNINPDESRILLLEGAHKVLPTYQEKLQDKAIHSLKRLGVEMIHHALATGIDDKGVDIKNNATNETLRVESGNIFWAAGVKATNLGPVIAERLGATTDRTGRIQVNPDCTVPGHPDIFVIGDMAHFRDKGGNPLPGVATVAMQQGDYCANVIIRRQHHKPIRDFRYRDKGSLAVIGRNAAVADIANMKFSGYPAWIIWVFVHLYYLIGFENRLLVFIQWAIFYFTRHRGARLITSDDTKNEWFEKEITEYAKQNQKVGVL